eukprot:6144588-Ditylum_brightwellii.AAC.1
MLHRQCWEARKRTLGEKHPDTLMSLSNVASAVHGQGKYTKAEMLHRQCLEARKKTLGEMHPDTLDCLNNVASA